MKNNHTNSIFTFEPVLEQSMTQISEAGISYFIESLDKFIKIY